MSAFRYYFGIDPDIEKNGFAIWDSKERKFLFIGSADFFEVCGAIKTGNFRPLHVYLDDYDKSNCKVIISAGWLLDKSSWHLTDSKGKEHSVPVKLKIASNVGMNHGAGLLLEQYCKNIVSVNYELTVPKGKMNGATNIALFNRLCRWPGRTNEDARDAAMLVVGL
jgi:hypothetical protein